MLQYDQVFFLKDKSVVKCILSYVSSASGEPAQCMACSCLFAVKHAVEEARAEVGKGEEYFVMSE